MTTENIDPKTPPKSTKKHGSIKRKNSARIAAVQGIYKLSLGESGKAIDVTQKMLDKFIEQLDYSQKINDKDWKIEAAPDKVFLQKIMLGIGEDKTQIQERLESIIKEGWKIERMSPVIIAILKCAIYELIHIQQLDKNIIIDEYVTITASFFDDPELSFVHGALHELSDKIR